MKTHSVYAIKSVAGEVLAVVPIVGFIDVIDMALDDDVLSGVLLSLQRSGYLNVTTISINAKRHKDNNCLFVLTVRFVNDEEEGVTMFTAEESIYLASQK